MKDIWIQLDQLALLSKIINLRSITINYFGSSTSSYGCFKLISTTYIMSNQTVRRFNWQTKACSVINICGNTLILVLRNSCLTKADIKKESWQPSHSLSQSLPCTIDYWQTLSSEQCRLLDSLIFHCLTVGRV